MRKTNSKRSSNGIIHSGPENFFEITKLVHKSKASLQRATVLADGWREYLRLPEGEKYIDELEQLIRDCCKQDWGENIVVNFNREKKVIEVSAKNREVVIK